jgi:hypothetical protein
MKEHYLKPMSKEEDVFLPEGEPKIAQRFSVGIWTEWHISLVGTTECWSRVLSSPRDLDAIGPGHPALKGWALVLHPCGINQMYG